MKQLLILFIVQLAIFSCYAQKKAALKIYLLDSNFNGVTDITKASHILNVDKINDTTFQYMYYNATTFKAEILETYKDEDGTIANGNFIYYNANGNIDSIGLVKNGKRESDWHFYNRFMQKEDSLIATKYYKDGLLIPKPSANKIYHKVETEAKFNGNFKKFLEQHLKYPNEAINMQATGVVTTNFLLSVDGIIEEIYIQKSTNYFLDMEALRIIKKSSGKWVAGKQDGVFVRTYHQQSINFVMN